MNNKITFVELVDLMSKATSTAPLVCDLFLRELFATVSQSLIDGEQVKIKGLGTFKLVAVKGRKSVNVATGQAMEISGYDKVTFTPDKSLAEAVNHPFAQFETVILDDAVTDDKLAAIDKESPSTALAGETDDDAAPIAPLPDHLPDLQEPVEPAPAPSFDGLSDMVPMADPVEPREEPKPEPEPASEPEPEKAPVSQEPEPEKKEIIQPAANPEPTVKPMLVGRPIDGPKMKHAPEPEKEEVQVDDYFYRPAPRNAYKPTEEQLARQKAPNRRWLWILLGVLAIGLLVWLFTRGGDGKTEHQQEEIAVADTVVEMAEPEMITDTITTKVVLTTLADKYYDSQWFWVYIYEENKGILSDPNNVPPGTVVVIPPAEKYGIDVNDPASVKKAQRLSWELLRNR